MKYENKVILHIDDDEANRYAVRRILERSGFSIIEADTGLSGIDQADLHSPDLIVLDIKLPDISGFEVCKRIKANPLTRSIPVLQTSASFVKSEHKVTGLESGADGYLAQPIEAAVLVATVNSLLRIREAEQIATRATRSRDQMLAIVSHDLRNPLSFILLQTKLMEKQLKTGKISQDQLVEKIQKINSSCIRMNRLIQDLLDANSIEENKLSVQFEPVNATVILQDAFQNFSEMSALSQINMRIHLPKEEVLVRADKDRLNQAVTNILSNSLKFTPAGGSIDLRLIDETENVVFVIEDTGSGIEKEHLPHVTDRYWKGSADRKGSFGLGLSIVKGIVQAHHGKLTIDSEVNVGTKTQISLPKAQ
jgi:signal transduction histidine kinase